MFLLGRKTKKHLQTTVLSEAKNAAEEILGFKPYSVEATLQVAIPVAGQ